MALTSLDFSQAKIQAIGTAFTAMKVAVNTKTKQQLEEEEGIGQSSDTPISKPYKTPSVQDKTISINPNEQTVLFADPTNGNLVKLNLSNENIDKLKKHFTGGNDFFEKKDGSLRLNGEAEAFVSGWFGDIAYKREFLGADINSDGKLSEEEYKNTRNEFRGHGEAYGIGKNVISIKEVIAEQYVHADDDKARMIKYNQLDKNSESIYDELNKTLKVDSNLNGEISLQEAYSLNGQNYTKVVLSHAIKALGNIDDNRPNPFEDKTDAELELLLLQTRALQKLRASNGNENHPNR